MQGHQAPPRSVLGHRSTVGTPSQPMRVAAALPRHQAGDGAGPAPHRPPPSTNNAQRGSSLILPPGAASSSSAGPNNSIGASALVLPPARGRLVVPAAASAAAARSTQSTPSVSHTAWTPPKTPLFLNNQRVHSLHERGLDVINSLTGWAQSELLRYLKPVSKSWQPADLLPDPASPEFYDQVTALRAAGSQLPYEYLVVLVGDMVTEEALPSYMNMLNTLDGTKDETGEQAHPWAHWTRHWTAEENRHGDLLNKYLYLCGRVDMRAVETTIQRLISSGLDPKLENNPYLCFVYTSFQERATKVSHGNTARLAAYYGDNALTRICGLIAADEGRHEAAYSLIVDQFFQRDPEGAVLAFADMMRKGIVMPAHLVDDGVHGARNNGANLFTDYATVADAIGVYTTTDYANIVDHLVSRWRVADLQGLSGEAAEAQEFLCGHSNRIRRLANIQAERRLRDRKRGRTREASFSWIQGRQVSLN